MDSDSKFTRNKHKEYYKTRDISVSSEVQNKDVFSDRNKVNEEFDFKPEEIRDIVLPSLIGRPCFNSNKRNIPTFTMSKSKRDAKVLDKELVKHENFGIHAPDVGTYNPSFTTFSGPKFSMPKFEKFFCPKQKVNLIKQMPHAYSNIYTERQIGPK